MTHEQIKTRLEDALSWLDSPYDSSDVRAIKSDIVGLINDLGRKPGTIEELDEAIFELKKQIVELGNKRNELRVNDFVEQTGFAVGAKVTVKGKPGIVSGHAANFLRVVPIVRLYKKDGTLGVPREAWHETKLIEQ